MTVIKLPIPQGMQLSREKGFRLQAASRRLNGLPAAKVDRTTTFGNPFRVGEPVSMKQARRWGWPIKHPEFVCETAEEAVQRFSHALAFDEAIHGFVQMHLRGKNLACSCDLDQPCHRNFLLRIANA